MKTIGDVLCTGAVVLGLYIAGGPYFALGIYLSIVALGLYLKLSSN